MVYNPTISKLKSIEGPVAQKADDNSKNSFFSDILKPFQSLSTNPSAPPLEEPEPTATAFKPAIVTVSLGIPEKGETWIPDYHQKNNRTAVQEFCSILPNNPVIHPTRKQITDFMSTITDDTDLSQIFYDIATQLQHTNWKNRLRALYLIYEFLISNAPGCKQYFLSEEGHTALMSLSGSVQKTIKDKLHAVLAILNDTSDTELSATLFDGLQIKETQDELSESSLFSGLTLENQNEMISTEIPQNTLSTNNSSDLNILEQIFPEVESSLYSFINSETNIEPISNPISNANPITNINSGITTTHIPQPFVPPTISHTPQYSQTDPFLQPVVPTNVLESRTFTNPNTPNPSNPSNSQALFTQQNQFNLSQPPSLPFTQALPTNPLPYTQQVNQQQPMLFTQQFQPLPPTPLSYPQTSQFPSSQPYYYTQTQPVQPVQSQQPSAPTFTNTPQYSLSSANQQRNPSQTHEGLFKVDWSTQTTNSSTKDDPFDFVKIQKKNN
eukprot:TRINITY_DN20103_c0_g2_i2.p1 TRINITY_DN20103_c0_g2~~TRINITY_DN20103_c0_g2_i2.p1  ORF type:complete len:498 (+),score=128.39 TRINITY_DN20103_c0_g2_i2:420-1913(+)